MYVFTEKREIVNLDVVAHVYVGECDGVYSVMADGDICLYESDIKENAMEMVEQIAKAIDSQKPMFWIGEFAMPF
jgi:hypothetical protein